MSDAQAPDDAVEYPLDGVLDLHQFDPGDAKELVADYLDACREKGVLDVRIIHGKGKGVLRRLVHAALERRDDVVSFRTSTDGGSWGATVVRLKALHRNAGYIVVATLALALAACGTAAGPEADSPAPAGQPESTPSPAEPGAEAGAGPEGAEVVSLLDTPLYRPALSAERREQLEANLTAALAELEADPTDEDRIVWYGRRLAYLSRYRDAIDVYSGGLEHRPDSWKLRRHRGHRYITLRDFAAAIADLSRAAELVADESPQIEPDGIPNALNQPLSNGHFNIWYHLGLAHYLAGDFEAARDAYLRCMEYSDNNDLVVATTDWLYMTYRRLGEDAAAAAVLAPIDADMQIVENDSYHRRLLMYKGEIEPAELLDLRAVADPDVALSIATQGYGVGNWYLVNGDRERAEEIFRRILEWTSWAAFGYIAAEADLYRWGEA